MEKNKLENKTSRPHNTTRGIVKIDYWGEHERKDTKEKTTYWIRPANNKGPRMRFVYTNEK